MATPTMPLEVAVFSAADAILASSQGCQRIELNAPGSYPSGGLTPPVSELATASASLGHVPLRVMIRPTIASPDDFVYTADDFASMKASITSFIASGSMNLARGDGFVFGIVRLLPDGRPVVDVESCSELVRLAAPFPCVFHRAFDAVLGAGGPKDKDTMASALHDLVLCGVKGLLTSGAPGSHADHLDRLTLLVRLIKPEGIQLVVGGGVRPDNATRAVEKLAGDGSNSVWLHSACLAPNSDRHHIDSSVLAALLSILG